MQNTEDINEILEYGEPETGETEPFSQPPQKGYSILPLLQTACCALIIVALLFLKYQNAPKYDEVTTWYKEAIAEEIELPRLQSPLQPAESDGEEHSLAQSPEASAEGSNNISEPQRATQQRV